VGAYSAAQANAPDKMANLRFLYVCLLLAFLISYPLGLYTSHFLFLASLIGILKKAGTPKFDMEYMQGVVLAEDFQNVTYFMSIIMAPKGLFLYTPLIISAVLALACEFKKSLDSNPSFPLLSISAIKNQILKAAGAPYQERGRLIRGNIEVYVGFYLIAAIPIGMSNIMAGMMYWQMMRMRYMMSPIIQGAFTKLHNDILGYLAYPYVPGFLGTAYGFISGGL
jgi:hypothetical protein